MAKQIECLKPFDELQRRSKRTCSNDMHISINRRFIFFNRIYSINTFLCN